MEILLKQSDPARVPMIIDAPAPDDEDVFSAIRCPCCHWRPDASSRWSCLCIDTPEPYFEGCGTTWNTFSTRGRCPGCGHQWRWTSCLLCAAWSPHSDWYEDATGAP